MSHNLENDPIVILKSLKKNLSEVNNKIDETLKAKNLADNPDEIDIAIEYLNQAIRQLDHATENLLETKNRFSA